MRTVSRETPMPVRPNDGVCVPPKPPRRSRIPALLLVGVFGALSLAVTTQRIAAERRTHTPPLRLTRDPGFAAALARVRTEVTFPAYCFEGPSFPEPSPVNAAPWERELGPCTLRTSY